MELSSNITEIKGIGEKKAQLLQKLNINNVSDMLGHYPRNYQNRTNYKYICEVRHEEEVLVSGVVVMTTATGYMYKKRTLRVLVDDGTGKAEIIFFNAKYIMNYFKKGQKYSFFGKASKEGGKLVFLHPEYFAGGAEDSQGILPIYPLSAGLTQSEMRKWQNEVQKCVSEREEYLPETVIENHKLCPVDYALKNIHFPENMQKLKVAKFRLVFEELLLLQIGLLSLKKTNSCAEGISFSKNVDVKEFINSFPYELTGAQKRVTEEIMADMESGKTMNRLVQGDVGSGKTAIAEIGLYKAVKCGFQGVMMAPTEILARQHFEELSRIFKPFGIRCGFLSGSLTAKEKRECLALLEAGEIDILVGTHALIQPDVKFKNLGLVITDEQHRFGVNQRRLLADKGKFPDTLVMTATPIPRTLAIILYGDLDISIIDELPKGRKKIITKAITGKDRIKAYEFVRKQVAEGRQCYVVAPLIEDSESIDVKSAEGIYEELCEGFPEFKTSLLHGDMKQNEKDAIMEAFKNGETDVLVSTVVIEVGINVPNATLMIIENSERFGLAQLHQLRGRVGRGDKQSYCILINEGNSAVAAERAEIMVSSTDGFVISEKDLELRGPGEFFGTKQHGIPELKVADLAKHTKILAVAQTEAKRIMSEDPELKAEENQGIYNKLMELFPQNF